MWMILVAVGGLFLGLWAALSYFWGGITQDSYRNWLLLATLIWFFFATWGNRKAG